MSARLILLSARRRGALHEKEIVRIDSEFVFHNEIWNKGIQIDYDLKLLRYENEIQFDLHYIPVYPADTRNFIRMFWIWKPD